MRRLALDVGGANLKAAHSSGLAASASFALWKEPDALAEQLQQLADRFSPFDELLVTMTGELCDCFATRRAGVHHILAAVQQLAGTRPVHVWTTAGSFVRPAAARDQPMLAAASNWHALATCTARLFPEGLSLLIDTGSTTTDILLLDNGRLHAQGLTDTARLATGELVYVGSRRTSLMALGPQVVFLGRPHRVMAEHFATTQDLFILTSQLREEPSCTDTADARPLTAPSAAARVLRMVGSDLNNASFDEARALARAFVHVIQHRLGQAIVQVLAGRQPDRVIVSGSGSFLAEQAAAATLDAPIVPLADTATPDASIAACAWALLQLAP